ncbi:cell division cycle-associated protein 2 isoform X1 [Alosa alosa]|uniref:cell division cycle-associated protein 2 isoform X1 n=1 Tax=Alosa alosa TaxID=278164 RepID=UPI00201549BF|nr:cell division cycle-associated protein 2 isoform X1 [Alosa alosa]
MASLGSTSDMDCLNMALLDTPTSPTSPEQGGRTAPLDFPHATPLQFGITTNSFSVPSKLQDKSRVSQLKARRRSTIGVRGSPETNALIRYIAKQRMQASSPTTEHLRLQSSLPRTQTLKQKMAAFQIVMEEVDEEGKLELMITPGKSDQKLECIGAGNTHSDKLDSLLGKENRVTPGYLSPATPPPSKRVYRGPLQECEGKIRGATFSAPQEKVRVFDFQSIAHQDTTFHRQVEHMPFPVLSQQTKASLNRRDEPGVSSVTKKKRVHFGAPLSPEFFDKTLPPSTPLQKGGTPFRQPVSAGSNLRPLLKTPQRNEASIQQPDFNSPGAADGSPTLSQTKVLQGTVSSDIVFRDTEDEVPRLVLEENAEVDLVTELNSAGISEDASSNELRGSQAHVVTSLFQTEPFLEEQTAGSELKLVSSPQQQQDPATSSSPARPRGRKRKPPAAAHAESEPQPGRRRPSRSAAVSASGKMKDSAGKRRFGSKEVDRSLYGRRVYASKNPLLSPVFESQGSSSGGVTPANPSGTSTGNGVPRKSLPTQSSQSEIVSDVVTAASRWRQRFCPQPTEEPSDMSDLTEAQQATGDHPPEIPADGSEVSSLPSQAASSTTPRGRGRPSRANPKPKTPKAEAAPAKPTVRRSRGRRSGSLRSDAAAHMTEAQPAGEEHENVTGQSRGQIHPEAESALSSQPTRDHHESGGLQLSPRHSTETADTHGAEAALSHEPCGETEHQTVTSADGRQSPAMEGDESDVDTLQHQDPAGPSGKQRKRAVGGRAKRRSSRIQLSAVMEEGGPGQENGEVTDEKESELPAPSGLEDSGKAGVSESKGTDKNGLEDRDAQEHRVNSHADNKTSLAPWQQIEFSIEDVLKPVPSSRRSVRRSLRNRSEQVSESGAFSGLAWVAHTSPDIAAPRRAGRRRNSSRLSINLQPPNLLEEPEPQDEPEPAEP